MTPPFIGLYSPAPQSGKTTLAQALTDHGLRILKFADPLRALFATLARHTDIPQAHIHRMLDGDLKHEPIPALGNQTPRRILQTLGTEWGRDLIARDLWTSILLRRAEAMRASGVGVVVDDMRFPNEAHLIRSMGGVLVRIIRPDARASGAHASEGALDTLRFDLTLTNVAPTAAEFARKCAPLVVALTQTKALECA